MSSSSSGNNWCTIESDPGVFTCLIESFGVKNAELSELWSLDDDSLSQLGKVYGLIFLFKWRKEDTGATNEGSGESEVANDKSATNNRKVLTGDDVPSDLFFARQTVHNACATQAILSVLFNAASSSAHGASLTSSSASSDLSLGQVLSTFQSFTSSFPPDLRGEAIGASEEIRSAHNSFARNDPFVSDEKKRIATDDDDVFHFVAYVPHESDAKKEVFELDGLKAGPVLVGSYGGGVTDDSDEKKKKKEDNEEKMETDDDGNEDMAWLRVARSAIQERIERYSSSEIKFNLMAIVRDRRSELNDRLQVLRDAGVTSEEDESISAIRAQLVAEEEKRVKWKIENERRRHNYIPFCVELLRSLAKSGKLQDLTNEARERMANKAAVAKSVKVGGDASQVE